MATDSSPALIGQVGSSPRKEKRPHPMFETEIEVWRIKLKLVLNGVTSCPLPPVFSLVGPFVRCCSPPQHPTAFSN